MKYRSASALIAASVALFLASLAVAQVAPGPGGGRAAALGVGVLPNVARAPLALQPQGASPPGPGSGPGAAGAGRPGPAGPPPTGAPAGRGPTPPVANAGGAPGAAGGPGGGAAQGPTDQPGYNGQMGYQAYPRGASVSFNLTDADLPQLVAAIGNITGRRFIIGSKARSIKTTIYSPTRISPGEAYQAFLSVLETNGMTVVPGAGGRFLVVEDSAGVVAQPVQTFASGEAAPADERFITRIHRLRNISAEDAATVLGHFKSRDADITAHPATNTLIITDTGSNLRRMMQILSEIDVPAVGEQIWIERINYATATEITQRVTELLGGGNNAQARPGGGAAAGDTRLTRMVADERSNSVIIVATERMYHRVLELIRRLDVAVEGEGEIHVQYLQHADAEELGNTLNQITGGGRQANQNAARGAQSIFEGPVRITADKRTNALVINSSPRDYATVRRVIRDLDRQRRQVFIEAVVMEIGVNNTTKVGVNWHGGAPTNPNDPTNSPLVIGGFQPLNSLGLPVSAVTNQDAMQGAALGVRGPYIPGTQNLVPGLTLGLPAFGAIITAMANSGDTDVLATPSIIATDGAQATINVGQNIPLQTNVGGASLGGLAGLAGAAGATGAAGAGLGALGALGGLGLGSGFAAPRSDVGTKISVLPRINDSNDIRMEIDEEISEAGDPQGALGAVPINRRTAKTTVVVQDQQTVVIGGLIRNAVRRGTTRIPLLGDIPLLGALFRTEQRTVERRNLLLFMTPYLIRDQSDLRRIFERKMRERQEFLDRYFVFSESQEYQVPNDYARSNGLLEEMRQSVRELRVQAEIESRAAPRTPPPHIPSDPIELPPGAALSGGGGGGPSGAPPPSGVGPAGPAGGAPPRPSPGVGIQLPPGALPGASPPPGNLPPPPAVPPNP